MTVHFYIHSITKSVESVALLDSAATENFMNLSYAKWLSVTERHVNAYYTAMTNVSK